jgi:hypothetical protein
MRGIFAAALSLAASSAQGASLDSCKKLSEHVVVAHRVRLRKADILFDKVPINEAQLPAYLHAAKLAEANTVILLVWKRREQGRVSGIAAEIWRAGLEVAMNCPPFPF